jgi:thiol:disulfide interchange protein DsbD
MATVWKLQDLPMRRVRNRNRPLIGFVSFGILSLVFQIGGDSRAAGATDLPKPASKDSSLRAKPKDAVLTAVVKPTEAKPGETVALQVTAKLNPGWHIYTQAKTQEGEGPRNTVFDLFDTAGFEIAGDWKPSRKPESKAEPAFDNKVFAYFEDEVTWSIPLKIPAGTSPGKKAIRVQASYQICNAQSCSFPGRWTLPDASVTVLEGDSSTASKQPASSVTNPQANASDIRAPARKDSSARIRPKGVTVTAAADPTSVHPGQSVAYKVTAKLEPGLHIYAVAKEDENVQGPIPTTFDFFDSAGFEIAGEWKPDRDPEARPEPAFGNQIIQFFENEVTWSLTLKAPQNTTPGKKTLRCQAGYQICNDRSCYPPGRWTLPDVSIDVVTPENGAGSSGAVANSKQALVALAAPAGPGSQDPTHEIAPAAPTPAPRATSPAAAPSDSSGQASVSNAISSSAPATTPAAPVSEIARRAQEGLVPFLLASAIGGVFALVMPCVWPMIPITVNFFVKQGQGKGKGRTTSLAIAYCLAIIAIFTAVGVFFSAFFSATFLQDLANNSWLNLLVAALFLAFGLSLLGLFEISLPSFLLNASAQGEGRGGLIGVCFMALTLTITSFTCTFPVVGGLLVMAAGGSYLYPILGLATFATVLALPFFLLALSPGLLSRMPRSGDWMNSVKVVGGLVVNWRCAEVPQYGRTRLCHAGERLVRRQRSSYELDCPLCGLRLLFAGFLPH